jgi:2'-5' RNA ligase
MGMKFSTLAGVVTAICLAALSVGHAEAAESAEASDSPGEIVAIDVLLHPDATMLAAAAKANAALRGDYPAGFALDELHTPHISMIQRFVRRDDLERIYGELGEVFAKTPLTRLKLQAVGYYSLPVGELGLAGIVIEPTKELRELQDRIIAAVEPFAVKGTGAAFVPSADGAAIAPSIVEYVNTYVPERSGKDFNPHVTVGLGSGPFVKRLIAAPFPKFAFGVKGASVYHLGNYGTAAAELWSPEDAQVAK